MKNYGEAYWHRVHQIPGVILCPKHNAFVLNSSVYWHGINKNEYIAANNENCKIYSDEIVWSELERNKLMFLSKNIEWMLNQRLKNNSMEWLHEKYINILNLQSMINNMVNEKFPYMLMDGSVFAKNDQYIDETIKDPSEKILFSILTFH